MTFAPRTLADLGWPTLLAAWVNRCATTRAARAIARDPWVADRAAAEVQLRAISEARRLRAEQAALPLAEIADIEAALERVRRAAGLEAAELIAVAKTGRAFGRLRTHLGPRRELVPALAAAADGLADLGHVYLPILEGFDADGRLVDHASEELGPLRRARAAIAALLERRMKELLDDDKFAPYLQDAYYTQREDRYVLPVRHDGKGFVTGIVHGTSQSGQTLFIEPTEIVDLNNRLKLAECAVQDEERRILLRFSTWVAEEADAFARALEAATALDRINAAAVLADDLVAAAPIIASVPCVRLRFARHPLMLLAERRCVANDIDLDAGQTLIISGPNAGGKTVALKTCGLAALMLRAGLHIVAESGSELGWFDEVVTDIGDAQSLEQNLSTFTGHVVHLGETLARARPGMLLLVDELASGTDPDQGAALAQAAIEALAARGVTALITTHYPRLKTLGATDPRCRNASVGFDLARMEPTFKLHLGAPGSSGALAVAKRFGLLPEVVARAHALLGLAEVKVEDLLANVQEQRRRLEEERAAVLAELEQLEADRAGLRQHRDQVRARYEQQARSAHGDAVVALRTARRDIDDARQRLRDQRKVSDLDVKVANRRISTAATTVAQHEPARELPPGTPVAPATLAVGAHVIVPALGGRAQVVSAPVDGKVEVQIGAMRARVAVADVLLDSHRAAQRAKKEQGGSRGRDAAPTVDAERARMLGYDGQVSPAAAGGRAGARSAEATVDVRGHRVDDAVAAIDRFIDESLVLERDLVWIIHGHGTGALRAAVRAYVKQHRAVRAARPGEASEGGDGVTIIEVGTR